MKEHNKEKTKWRKEEKEVKRAKGSKIMKMSVQRQHKAHTKLYEWGGWFFPLLSFIFLSRSFNSHSSLIFPNQHRMNCELFLILSWGMFLFCCCCCWIGGKKWVMGRHDVCVYTEHAIKTTGEEKTGKQSGSRVTSLMARCSLQFHTHALEN